MIRTNIYLERYDWMVRCYIAVTHYACDDILATIRRMGCRGKIYDDAKNNLCNGAINSGLTYTSFRKRESVMVTAIADSAKEQYNTLSHEIAHVCAHIAEGVGIDPSSEEYAYLVGDFSMALFPKVKRLLCDCCRQGKR